MIIGSCLTHFTERLTSSTMTVSSISDAKVDIKKLHQYNRFTPHDTHYDKGRNAESKRDTRRLILSAECQVGKTGAYLHYLQLLSRAASTIAVPHPLPTPDEGSPSRDIVSWLLPCWNWLYGEPPLRGTYGRLFGSKYSVGVANKRTYLVLQSCKREGSWVSNFQKLLCDVSGEAITSKAGKRLLAGLNEHAVAPFNTQGQRTQTLAAIKSLGKAIDWDGRFHSQGVRLCVCDGECTPECCKQNISDAYRGHNTNKSGRPRKHGRPM